MSAAADRPFSGYSSGMKQRIAIARALLHDPPILLMDEPTRSLDPAAALALRELIDAELRHRDGKTILLATHNLHEAQALSDRVAILVAGRVRRSGTVDEVRRFDLATRFRLELLRYDGPLVGPFRVESDVRDDGVRRVEVSLPPGTDLDAVFRALWQAGASIRSCDRVEPDLEQAFARALAAEGEPA
jgi:ABC-type multidrug transport system ATPase subunit